MPPAARTLISAALPAVARTRQAAASVPRNSFIIATSFLQNMDFTQV